MAKKQSKSDDLPTSIVVGGLTFTIKKAHLDDHVWGDCAISEREIRISTECPADKVWSTFLHELIHACLGVGGLNEIMDSNLEEAIARNLEHNLAPILGFE